jgi:ketopantoate hydroxymethyltransferase
MTEKPEVHHHPGLTPREIQAVLDYAVQLGESARTQLFDGFRKAAQANAKAGVLKLTVQIVPAKDTDLPAVAKRPEYTHPES